MALGSDPIKQAARWLD
jgi:putative flippase GtrA